MPQVRRLHQKHVMQVACALEAVVLRIFGPEGGQVLFTRENGHVMLSRSGTRILTALRLDHPLARMMVECVWKHSGQTGDGSKSFILLLASLLRTIYATGSKELNVSRVYNSREAAESASARRLADQTVAFALEELEDLIAVAVAPYGFSLSAKTLTASTQSASHSDRVHVEKLIASFFHTRLGFAHSDFMGELIFKLLLNWSCKNDKSSSSDNSRSFQGNLYVDSNGCQADSASLSLRFLNDNFHALHTPVSGFPVSSSRLIEGQVIHRDFATHDQDSRQDPVKAVVLTVSLQPKWLNASDTMEIGNGTHRKSIVHFSAWAECSLEHIFATLQALGVSVLLSAVKQSDAVLTLATQAQIRVVECIGEDELALFLHLSGASAVSDCWGIKPEHIASLTFCRSILLGAHRYVHVAFSDSREQQPCNIIICGLGEGQTDQYAGAVQDVIHMLRTTWEPQGIATKAPSSISPGCVIPAGGIFELLLHRALLQHGHSHAISKHTPVVRQVLADAILHLPRHVHSGNERHFLQIQSKVWSLPDRNPFQPDGLFCKPGFSQAHCGNKSSQGEAEQSMYCSLFNNNKTVSELESVSCKYHLILAVLHCVKNLLRLDAVLHTPTQLHPKSLQLTYSSEDED
ncbi:Bardet-Biedl syndrome 10 protein isoform X2 [Syngnathoides biaculeatus]|nr:Bardet-Biedl syndrome 10 protein isoform X2 [Syngnathoides biaculeatus]XP_061679977.1 Bardet-Biedl syndrome 10 protein isoform X2 [Syngnathoides biaculeatus]XP_061679978.1 Bardet-Biedl syndrome 10 protein isoform X2 [Syngnathoides biaculeatus]XP_061679979.1 Bardet-Biedl syndrome 10 protein isoform X2 [Syngnathoides biaculeatus]